MYRNLFAVFATLALGTGAASAATATTQPTDQSLEQRLIAAQKSIVALTPTQEAVKGDSKVAQYYYGGGYRRPYFANNYFPNYFRNYYGG